MIYFIGDGEYVKIGFTDQDDVQDRLNSLQIGNARKLVLYGTIDGGREVEVVLHRVFGELRVRGEWFAVTLDAIAPLIDTEKSLYQCSMCDVEPFGSQAALNAHQRVHKQAQPNGAKP